MNKICMKDERARGNTESSPWHVSVVARREIVLPMPRTPRLHGAMADLSRSCWILAKIGIFDWSKSCELHSLTVDMALKYQTLGIYLLIIMCLFLLLSSKPSASFYFVL